MWLVLLTGCLEKPAERVFTGSTMGTTWSVKVVGEAPPVDSPPVDSAAVDSAAVDSAPVATIDDRTLRMELEHELRRINALMSTYQEDSEISRFNRSPTGEPFPVSEDLLQVVRLAREIHEDSGGAFDITVGPLVNLWGFGPDPATDRVPEPDAIEAARRRTGFHFLTIGDTTLTRTGDIYIDLSAIAKGYAVDQLSGILDAYGFQDYLVEIGGELRARGRNGRGEVWRIAVEKPESLSRSVYLTIDLQNLAMATSGDYRNYFEVDGVRYSHTIDPRTGRPITHNIASVTVLDSETARADGYATAIDVMGLEQGMKLAAAKDLAVLVIIKTDGGFEEYTSALFQQYTGQ